MKYFSAFLLLCIFFMKPINGSDMFSEKDSLLSSAELESTILFLEDSQRVKALTSQLRMIFDARRSIGVDTIAKEESVSLNFLQLFNKLKLRAIVLSGNIQKEIHSIPDQISNLKDNSLREGYAERLYSFLIVVLIAVMAGSLAGVFIWKTGHFLMGVAENKNGIFQKFFGALSHFLIKSSFSSALICVGLVLVVIPTGFELRGVIYKIISGISGYIVVAGITHSLWNTEHRRYRIMSISNEASAVIVKSSLSFFRFSLMMFILYCISDRLWHVFAVFLSGLYKIIIIYWLPSILSTHKQSISKWFVLTTQSRKMLPQVVISVMERFLLRMHNIASVFLVGITLIWLLGFKTLYVYMLGASLRTAGVVMAAIILMAFWISILSSAEKMVQKISSGYSDLKIFFVNNVVVFRRFGLICIIAASALFALHFWGISLEGVFKSENLILKTTAHVVFILLGAFLFVQLAKLIIEKFKKEAAVRMLSSNHSSSIEIEKRVATLGNIIQKIVIGGILLFAVIMVMDELGFDIKAMLAGVGIMGLAVGFGAQNLVRDIISGLFLIFENRIRVGDVAIINGTGGLVEQVNLRTSVLRSNDGTVHVFPNGGINSLSNMTHEFSYYVFDIGVSYKENLDKVISVLKDVGNEIIGDPEFKNAILEPLEILGVDSFKDSAIIIKARIKTEPIKQWFIGREMNKRIKRSFDKEGIEMPFPHRTVYLGDSGKPLPLRLEGTVPTREEIKNLMREVMMEDKEEARNG